jgi:hypothetical protein
MSNHPPEIELGLTRKQAQFLMDNCDRNIEFSLKAMMMPKMSREGAEKLVALNEQFKEIRNLLLAQGIESQ